MRRTPLLRKTPLRSFSSPRRTPINPESDRRRSERRRYEVLRKAFLNLDGDGEGRVCELCDEARATEVHHRRGRVGALYLRTDHWAALCRNCHAFLTENPATAYALGMSERRVGEAE